MTKNSLLFNSMNSFKFIVKKESYINIKKFHQNFKVWNQKDYIKHLKKKKLHLFSL